MADSRNLERRGGRYRRSLGYLVYLIPIVVILLAYAAVVIATNEPEPFTIVSGPSMQPTIIPGSIEMISDTPFQKLAVGDIIVFKPLLALESNSCQSGAPPTLASDAAIPCFVVHRIVSITRNQNNQIVSVTTKGDNNPYSISYIDNDINSSMYVGQVVLQFPVAGYATQYPYNVTIAALILLALIAEIYLERKDTKQKIETKMDA